MLFVSLSGLMLMLTAVLSVWLVDLEDTLQEQNRYLRYVATTEMGRELERYYDQNRSLPASIEAGLESVAGFEHLRTWRLPYQETAFTAEGPQIVGGSWLYRRGVIAYPDPLRVRELQGNSVFDSSVSPCGVAVDDPNWCPPENGFYTVLKTDERAMLDIAEARQAMYRTSYKLAIVYRANNAFPNSQPAGPNFVIGDGAPLTELVGYAGTANNCTGTFTWETAVFDCNDLFNLWGKKVVFTYLAQNEIGLSAGTGLTTSAGTDFYVSSIVSIPLE